MDNLVLFCNDTEPPDWAAEFFKEEDGPIRLITRLKKIKDTILVLEHRIVPAQAAAAISPHDLKHRMLTEVPDEGYETRTLNAAYTVASRLVSPQEARMLEVILGTPVSERCAIYYNHASRVCSVGKVIFIDDKTEINLNPPQ